MSDFKRVGDRIYVVVLQNDIDGALPGFGRALNRLILRKRKKETLVSVH